jgi:uncharacterized RDD family membrane protein YckC
VTADAGPAVPPCAPPLARRLASFVYEGVLLFGVVMGAGLIYGIATDQRHALVGAPGLRIFLFFVLGAYFVHFWSRSGRTLAMQTWHIRVVGPDGRPPGRLRATARYLLAWLWFAPALLALGLSGLQGGWTSFSVLLTGVLAYAVLSRLHPQRQFLHDALCGTRLEHFRPPRRT